MGLGFMIAGGFSGSTLRTAEVFNPLTGHSCLIEDLTEPRQEATMCNNMICGGLDLQSCELFDGTSSFTRLPVSLLRGREDHLCWAINTGEIILFGGYHSDRTTEKVSADGFSSTRDFNLSNVTRYLNLAQHLLFRMYRLPGIVIRQMLYLHNNTDFIFLI